MITPAAGQSFPYRFIAASLGPQCGTELFAPHTELVRVERTGYLGIIGLTTGYKTEVIVNAMPLSGRVERISLLRVWNETKILGSSTGRVYLTNFVFHSPSSNPTAWDGLPGGTQVIAGNAIGRIAQENSSTSNVSLIFTWGSSSNTYLADKFCFVPRASALDVLTLDQASFTSPYVNGLAGDSASRAEKFIAQEKFSNNGQQLNENHPNFPARQAQWIFNEMQQPITGGVNTAGCTTECTLPNLPLVITGPSNACGSVTYSAPIIAGATYSWTTSSTGAFSPATGTGPTFTTTAASSSNAQMTVAVVSPCPSTSFTYTVCSPLNVTITSFQYTNSCTSASGRPNYAQWTATAAGGTGPYTYKWYLDYGNRGTYTGPFNGGATFGQCLNSYSLVLVKVIVTSGGASAEATYYGYGQSFAIYPNPASDYVDVTSEDPIATASAAKSTGSTATGPAGSTSISAIRLFDSYGKLRSDQSGQEAASVRLRLNGLPAGFYVLHVLHGQEVISRQQLRIER